MLDGFSRCALEMSRKMRSPAVQQLNRIVFSLDRLPSEKESKTKQNKIIECIKPFSSQFGKTNNNNKTNGIHRNRIDIATSFYICRWSSRTVRYLRCCCKLKLSPLGGRSDFSDWARFAKFLKVTVLKCSHSSVLISLIMYRLRPSNIVVSRLSSSGSRLMLHTTHSKFQTAYGHEK